MENELLDPYIIHIGSGGIKWYSFFAFLGFLLAFICMRLYITKKYQLKTTLIEKSAFIVIPISLLGARIWYVIFNTDLIDDWYKVIAFWEGGLAIQGGILVGSIVGGLLFWKISSNKNVILQYADCVFPFILLGQALGRWGNYFNMEILGDFVSKESVSNLGIISNYLHYPFDPIGSYRFPLFLLQFFLNIFALVLIVGIVPLFVNVKKYSGILTSLFFIFSGLIRASMELERAEVDIMRDLLGTPVSFALAIVFITFGLLLLIFLSITYLKKKKVSFVWKDVKLLFKMH